MSEIIIERDTPEIVKRRQRVVSVVRIGDVEMSIDRFRKNVPPGFIARYQTYESDCDSIMEIHYHKGSKARRSKAAICGVGYSTKLRLDFTFSDEGFSEGHIYTVCAECARIADGGDSGAEAEE